MGSEICGDIPHPEPTIRVGIVGMRLDQLCKRLGMMSVPEQVLLQNRLGIAAWVVKKREDKIAVSLGIVRL